MQPMKAIARNRVYEQDIMESVVGVIVYVAVILVLLTPPAIWLWQSLGVR